MKEFKQVLAEHVSKYTGVPSADILSMIEYPPNPALGDLALPCFRFAKILRKSPAVIAEDVARAIDGEALFQTVEAVNGYLNIKLNREYVTRQTINTALDDVEHLFSKKRGVGDTAAVDYSSPNIAKPFGVGHLRSTIIGESIVRMLREDGFTTIGVNHLGDWGTQFGKNIAAFLKWGDEEQVRANPVRELFKLYVQFHAEAEKHPELEDEGRSWFKKLEDGEEQAVKLWKWFIDESLKSFKETYALLGVTFDHFLGESFYNDKMEAVVQELSEKGLLEESEGAEVVDLSAFDMPPCIIRKSDGATIYATRDLAAADYRNRVLGADRLIYVVGAEQILHFQQVFKVLELMGHSYAKDAKHVAFGLMKYNGERLSTRRGKVVYLEDVLNRAIEEAEKIIEEKNPDLADKAEVAKAVGIGAVIFNDLKTFRMHEVDFRYEDVLNFDGETGPYVQYTHARASSVLRKATASSYDIPASGDVITSELTDTEWALVHEIAQANEYFERALDEYDPSVMARFALDVCHAFNRFYHDNPILGALPNTRTQRVALTKATKQVLAHAMYLIGMQAPEAM